MAGLGLSGGEVFYANYYDATLNSGKVSPSFPIGGWGVTASGAMVVAVGAGSGYISGTYVTAAGSYLNIGAANNSGTRIDLITASGTGYGYYQGGYSSGTNVVTPPQVSDFECLLAHVRVGSGATSISAGNIRDTRVFAFVKGEQLNGGSIPLLVVTTLNATTVSGTTFVAGTVSGANVISSNISGTHYGNGAGLASLNATNVSAGTLAVARLSYVPSEQKIRTVNLSANGDTISITGLSINSDKAYHLRISLVGSGTPGVYIPALLYVNANFNTVEYDSSTVAGSPVVARTAGNNHGTCGEVWVYRDAFGHFCYTSNNVVGVNANFASDTYFGGRSGTALSDITQLDFKGSFSSGCVVRVFAEYHDA